MTRGIARLDEPARFDETGTPTQTRRDLIIESVRLGLPADIATAAAGIPMETMRRWLNEGRAVYQRTLADPDAPLTDEERAMGQFSTDVDTAVNSWLRDANMMLEAAARTTKITTTKRTTKDGKATEETVVERVGPGDLSTLMWRMGKVNPTVYGAQRIELTGVEGRPVEVDISAKLDELVGSIRAALSTDEPASSNGHEDGGS